MFEAHVVCKILGFPTAIKALANGAAADLTLLDTPIELANTPSAKFILTFLFCFK